MTAIATENRLDVTTFQDDLTGRTVRRLTHDAINLSPYFNSYAWSADGGWVFYIRVEGALSYIEACEVETGWRRRLAGPFRSSGSIDHEEEIRWGSLNAIPGTQSATFIADSVMWRVDLNGREPIRVAEMPYRQAFYHNSDVTGDGKWHVISAQLYSREGWDRRAEITWPPDPFYEKYLERTEFYRVALDGSGRIEHLFDLPKIPVSHVSMNPVDPDLIMYSSQTALAFQMGRVFLRRIGEPESRPVRDQRSGKAWVTHEYWFRDGKRFSYYGHYQHSTDAWPPFASYAGWFDIERDLPFEFLIEGPRFAFSHTVPSPDGNRLFMDLLPCEKKEPQRLYELILDRERGTCRREAVCGVTSDLTPLPNDQWRTIDPIFSPDGRRILFRSSRNGELHLYVVDLEEQ